MSTHGYTLHLDGAEKVRVSHGSNHDALHVESKPTTSSAALALPHSMPDRVRFLRELSEAADTLADEIAVRELGAAS